MTTIEVAEFKQHARATWAKGDYAATGAYELWPLGERIVEQAAVRPGERVLDVACGTGNAALRAAAAGGRVVGLDITPELLAIGREEADRAGVAVDFVEGDAEALPFEDAAFDVVLSTMGVMFAPRHDVAARELARVLAPGGRMALYTWALEGRVSAFFRTIGGYVPPAPDFAAPPPLWGSEEHVRGLFEGTGMQLEFGRGELAAQREFDSVDEQVEFFSTNFGPAMNARAFTEAQGTWEELRAEMVRHFAGDAPSEYLVILGRR